MNYDCIIIGGGLSGLTCGIKLCLEGTRCAIVSSGMSALHFSSGSIDLMGYNEEGKIIYEPYEFLKKFIDTNPSHPYAKCGLEIIKEAFAFFSEELKKQNLRFYNNGDDNHFHVTAMGTVKPTYLSQRSVFNERIKASFREKPRIAFLNFKGYRDFYPDLAASNLKKNSLFKIMEIVTGNIVLPVHSGFLKNPHEYRSIDIARIFDTEKYIQNIAGQIKKTAGDAMVVALPAFIGITNYNKIHRKLEELTGYIIYEIPTLPPSILGMRIDDALKARFASLGGVFISGEKVTGGEIKEGRVACIQTSNYGTEEFTAAHYVLSTGSFFSGGLVSEFNKIKEPVFNLKVYGDEYSGGNWYSPEFFSKTGQPFLEFGVMTDENFHPFDNNHNAVENLYCTSSMLSNYNPVREGSGGGVAISTGYRTAKKILEMLLQD